MQQDLRGQRKQPHLVRFQYTVRQAERDCSREHTQALSSAAYADGSWLNGSCGGWQPSPRRPTLPQDGMHLPRDCTASSLAILSMQDTPFLLHIPQAGMQEAWPCAGFKQAVLVVQDAELSTASPGEQAAGQRPRHTGGNPRRSQCQ